MNYAIRFFCKNLILLFYFTNNFIFKKSNLMKLILPFLIIFLAFQSCLTAQSEKGGSSFSMVIKNGISNNIYFSDSSEDEKIAYVNAIGLYFSFSAHKNLQYFVGLQYEKNGSKNNWVCDTNWDYCATHGLPPISVKTVNRLHYASLVLNGKYSFKKNFYIRGGWNLDVPFNQSYSYQYTDSNNQKSKEQDWNLYGRRIKFNTSLGANLTFGKSFPINDKLEWFAETGFKMYNLIGIRFDSYEDFLLERKQKPYVISINLGLTLR